MTAPMPSPIGGTSGWSRRTAGHRGQLEAPARLAERRTLGEAEDFTRAHLEHPGSARVISPQRPRIVVEGAVLYLEAPVLTVLREVGVGHAAQPGGVCQPHRLPLDDEVEPLAEGVAPGGEDAARVVRQVLRFALVGARAEVKRAAQQNAQKRRDVRAPVGTDRGDPVHLGTPQAFVPLGPGRRRGAVATESWVQLDYRLLVGHAAPFRLVSCGDAYPASPAKSKVSQRSGLTVNSTNSEPGCPSSASTKPRACSSGMYRRGTANACSAEGGRSSPTTVPSTVTYLYGNSSFWIVRLSTPASRTRAALRDRRPWVPVKKVTSPPG